MIAALDNYHHFIYSLHRDFGAEAWSIVYQGDVRARLEHLERLNRRVRSCTGEVSPRS